MELPSGVDRDTDGKHITNSAAQLGACACAWDGFCDLLGTFSSIILDLISSSRPHGDQSTVLMRENVISEVLFKVRGKHELVMVKVKE